MKIGYTCGKPLHVLFRREQIKLRLPSSTVIINLQSRQKSLIIRTHYTVALVASLVGLAFTTPRLNGFTYGNVEAATVVPPETVHIMASDCSTPQTTFYLGDTVCAVVLDAPPPSDGWRQRYFQWVTPNQWATQHTDIVDRKQREFFTIPASGEFARVGKWSLRTVDSEPGMQTITYFNVRDPRIRFADLKVEKFGPVTIHPSDRVEYTVWAYNDGPEDAREVELRIEVPSETTFVGLRQTSGNEFRCQTPPRGETGTIVCQIESLKLEERASFTVYYRVNAEARDEALSISSAAITSSVEEADKDDNRTTVEATVVVPGEDNGDPGEQP